MLNLMLGLAAAAALVSPTQARTTTTSSNASCKVFAFASSRSASKDAFVNFGKSLGVYVCDGDTSVKLEKTASDVAYAVAEAVAYTSIECTVSGEGSASGSAKAKASANATANAEALGQGYVSVETCKGCKASLDLLVEASKELFVSAIAESETQIKDFESADGSEKKIKRDKLVEDIQKKIAPTFVKLILEVETKTKDGEETCKVRGKACAVAGSEFGCCDITVGNAATSISTDAIAIAGASAVAEKLTCNDDEEVEANAYALAVATADAYAKALSEAHGWCKSTQHASACGWAEASITAIAKAQATAWADAYASAANKCGCKVDVTALADATEEILVKATSDLIAGICTDGDAFAKVDTVVEAIAEDHVTAIATAAAHAVATSDSCRATATACAESGESAACCTVSADAAAESFAKGAFAGVEGDAAVYLCTPGEAEAELNLVAKAFGTAWAKVVTEVNIWCHSNGWASACSLVDTYVRAVAKTEAEAFAQLWAGTLSDNYKDCGCQLNVDAVASSMVDIMVEATLYVFGEICIDGDGWVDEHLFAQAFEENNFEAFAKLFVNLKKSIHEDGSSHCTLDGEVVAGVDETVTEGTCVGTCAGKDQLCMNAANGETDADGNWVVRGCCDTHQHCVKIRNRHARCWDVDREPKAHWDGDVLTCTH